MICSKNRHNSPSITPLQGPKGVLYKSFTLACSILPAHAKVCLVGQHGCDFVDLWPCQGISCEMYLAVD